MLFAIIGASGHIKASAFFPFLPYGWTPVGLAGVIIFFSFVGWEMIAHLAEEFKNPSKDIPISLSLSAVIISVLYITLAIVTVGTHSYGEKVGLAPLNILIEKVYGFVAGIFTTFLALLITFGAVHTNIAGFSRMLYAQAREGDFPKIFAKLHPVHRTPVMALSGLATIFTGVLLFNVLCNPNLGFLIQWPSVIFIVSYMITMASALKLFGRKDIYWWLALISLVFCCILYVFSGWAMIYPPILALIGLVMSKKRWIKKDRPKPVQNKGFI